MYANTGYMDLTDEELEDYNIPLRTNCCGVYRLLTLPVMSTIRPLGRPDYQILYISSGKATFYINGAPREVPAGHMVIYHPRSLQQYAYYLEDKPEVYWLHFTGEDAQTLIKEAGFSGDHILYTGISAKYQDLFLSMIKELQLPRPCSEELSSLYLRQLFLTLKRLKEEGGYKKTEIKEEMEQAIHYFHENFTRDIQVEEYAKKLHMSTCWFIRSFKQYAGMPPGKYITSIRVNKAKELLESTDYTVGEIGTII